MTTKEYYPELDVVKGIAILMVIMGHSFCSHPINLGALLPTVFQQIINCCQMPLFFVASGFLFSSEDSWISFFQKKGRRLLIPYITFCILTIILRFAFAPLTNSGAPDFVQALFAILTGGYYWFLYVLFFIMLICKLANNSTVLIIIGVTSLIGSHFISEVPPIISRLIMYPSFFIGGIFLKKCFRNLFECLSTRRISLLAAICIIGYVALIGWGINSSLVFITQSMGCVGIWLLSVVLLRLRFTTRILTHFGHYSLQYYLNHLLIMLLPYMIAAKQPLQVPVLQWFMIFLMGVLIAWIMLRVEKKIKWLHPVCGL